MRLPRRDGVRLPKLSACEIMRGGYTLLQKARGRLGYDYRGHALNFRSELEGVGEFFPDKLAFDAPHPINWMLRSTGLCHHRGKLLKSTGRIWTSITVCLRSISRFLLSW